MTQVVHSTLHPASSQLLQADGTRPVTRLRVSCSTRRSAGARVQPLYKLRPRRRRRLSDQLARRAPLRAHPLLLRSSAAAALVCAAHCRTDRSHGPGHWRRPRAVTALTLPPVAVHWHLSTGRVTGAHWRAGADRGRPAAAAAAAAAPGSGTGRLSAAGRRAGQSASRPLGGGGGAGGRRPAGRHPFI